MAAMATKPKLIEAPTTLDTILKAHPPVPAPTKPAADPKVARHDKLIAALREQITLIDNPQTTRTVKIKGGTKQVPITPWWTVGGDGSATLQVRYGVRSLQLAPGCTALSLGKWDSKGTKILLEQIIEAVEVGELDEALAAAMPVMKPRAKKAA